MSKYNDDLINRYINGLDILEYSVDELEDDPKFMLEVGIRKLVIRIFIIFVLQKLS